MAVLKKPQRLCNLFVTKQDTMTFFRVLPRNASLLLYMYNTGGDDCKQCRWS